ncbi:hypothetical protein ACN6K3_002292, partial [Streptomyces sp. SAS_260]
TSAAHLPETPGTLPARHRAVLTTTDGRRTARDVAFTLGRGLFAVMLDLRHLLDRGLVEPHTPPPDRRPSTAPRVSSTTATPSVPGPASLPRRLPGRNSVPAHRPHD